MLDSATYPRVLLVEGDPYLALDVVLKTKREWFPGGATDTEWAVFDFTGTKRGLDAMLDSLDAEISTQDWNEGHKVIFVRGLDDSKKFVTPFAKFIRMVPEGNSLVIWDETGIMSNEDSTNMAAWRAMREQCKKSGQVVNVGPPLSRYTKDVHVDFIVNEMSKRSKRVTKPVAALMLELLEPERSALVPEMDKLATVCEHHSITEKDVYDHVFPMAPGHEFWLYATMFNTGDYNKIMQVAEMLVKNGEYDYQRLLSDSLRQAKWHLVAAHILTYNNNVKDSLRAFAASKRKDEVLPNLVGLVGSRYASAFKEEEPAPKKKSKKGKEDEDTAPKTKKNRSDTLTYYNANDVCDFVTGPLASHVAAARPKDQKKAMCVAAMERYLVLKEAMVHARTSPEDEVPVIFEEAIKKVTWRR